MESTKIKLPRYSQDQALIKLRIDAGVLLTQKHYEILVKDALDNLEGSHDIDSILRYLKLKYSAEFSRSRIIKELENANIQ